MANATTAAAAAAAAVTLAVLAAAAALLYWGFRVCAECCECVNERGIMVEYDTYNGTARAASPVPGDPLAGAATPTRLLP